MAGPDYIVDIQGLSPSPAAQEAHGRASMFRGRPWLSIYWKCCRTYSRIYRNARGDAYEGRCPKCGARVRAIIGSDGTSTRFFTAE